MRKRNFSEIRLRQNPVGSEPQSQQLRVLPISAICKHAQPKRKNLWLLYTVAFFTDDHDKTKKN